DGVFRHPSFKGMREDKKAKEVIRETKAPTADIIEETAETTIESAPSTNKASKSQSKKSAKTEDKNKPQIDRPLVKAPKRDAPKTLLNPKEETQVKKICGHDLKFTNLSKVYWPEDGITKRDLFNYYYQVAEYILPYLKDRPQSLNRFPNGIHGKSFYQKDVKGKAPDWVKTFPYTTSDGEDKEYLVGAD